MSGLGVQPRPKPKLVQIMPWRDMLLGLTDDGQIVRMMWHDEGSDPHFIVIGVQPFKDLYLW